MRVARAPPAPRAGVQHRAARRRQPRVESAAASPSARAARCDDRARRRGGRAGASGAGGGNHKPLDGWGTPSLCAQLAMKYQTLLLAAATACTPGAPNQCQVLVGNVPTNCPGSLCGQQSYVNDRLHRRAGARQSWLNAGAAARRSTCIRSRATPGPERLLAVSGDSRRRRAGTCDCNRRPTPGPASRPTAGESCDQLAADYTGGGERGAGLHARPPQPVPALRQQRPPTASRHRTAAVECLRQRRRAGVTRSPRNAGSPVRRDESPAHPIKCDAARARRTGILRPRRQHRRRHLRRRTSRIYREADLRRARGESNT